MLTVVEKLLVREEGLRLSAYRDSEGYWTIGVGRLIDARRGGGITEEEAAYLLRNDITRATNDLDAKLPWWRQLDEVRQAVVVSMCFQLGISGLLQFRRTLRAVQEGRYADAAAAMLQSLWAAQTPERARRAADAMKTGTAASLLP